MGYHITVRRKVKVATCICTCMWHATSAMRVLWGACMAPYTAAAHGRAAAKEHTLNDQFTACVDSKVQWLEFASLHAETLCSLVLKTHVL